MKTWLGEHKEQNVTLYCLGNYVLSGKVVYLKNDYVVLREQCKVVKDHSIISDTTVDSDLSFAVQISNIVYGKLATINECTGPTKYEYIDNPN